MGRVFVQNGNSVGETVIPWLGGISLEQLFLILYPSLLIPATFFWLRHLRAERELKTNPKGHTKLGQRGPSNLIDEEDEKYTVRPSPTHDASTQWKVKALYVHPIKSCGAIEVDTLDVDAAGPIWDRKFAVAELMKPLPKRDASEEDKKPRWTFRTLRQTGYERMVFVKPEIWLRDGTKDEGVMIVKFPYTPTGPLAPLDRLMIKLGLVSTDSFFSVPLAPPKDHNYPREDVEIWKDRPQWLNLEQHVSDEFRAFMGRGNPVTLFRVDPESYREVFRCAPRKEQVGYQPVVGFADAYPVHLMNLASVRDIAGKVRDELSSFTARRFRWNILVTGGTEYNEDDWKRVRIGENEMYCACHTIRCRLPNVDPDTSERHDQEPDRTLKSFRCIDAGDPKNAALGLQLVPANAEVVQIHVGDQLEVLERGKHHYLKQ